MPGAKTVLFLLLAAFALTPWGNPALSLLLGVGFALAFAHPFPKKSRVVSKYTLQAAVVGLGFGLDLTTIWRVGSQGFLLTFVTISVTLALGMMLGRLFNVERKSSLLISVGTAICGGSAIAAVGPVIHASDEEMSVSLGTVFILNAIALLLFPIIGHRLGMSENAFGLWAALAIHDTSSVVGATALYGRHALEVGTTVKLTRALWIIPVAFFFAYLEQRHVARASSSIVGHVERTSLSAVGKGQVERTSPSIVGKGQVERTSPSIVGQVERTSPSAVGQTSPSAPLARPKVQIPWFIGLFVLAAVIRSLVPGQDSVFGGIVVVAKALLSLTLFLIGAGLSRSALKKVGIRPLASGVILWIIVGVTTVVTIVGIS